MTALLLKRILSRNSGINNTFFTAIKRQRQMTAAKTHLTGNRSLTIKSIIFDFDGIIVDSEAIFYRANSHVLQQFGAVYTMELKHQQMGRKLTEGVDCILKRTGLADKGVVDSKKYIQMYEQWLKKELPNCEVMSGARALIEHLQNHKIQMAICTGSDSVEFLKKIGKCKDLMDKMNAIVLAGDDSEVTTGKPAPDPYLITMRRMQPQPTNPSSVLVFEDSINGVRSALAAGCRVIWIPQKQFMIAGWEKEEEKLKKEELFAEKLESLEEFRPEKYGLPAFDK